MSKNGWQIIKKHYHNGKLHHETEPALVDERGTKYWYHHGQLHRLDGPAIEHKRYRQWYIRGSYIANNANTFNAIKKGKIISKTGGVKTVSFYKNFKLHREGGPAFCETSSNDNDYFLKKWFYKGELHRLDGPAIETSLASFWYKRGKLHREDGPAIIHADGSTEYWYNDINIKCDSDKEFKSKMKIFW